MKPQDKKEIKVGFLWGVMLGLLFILIALFKGAELFTTN